MSRRRSIPSSPAVAALSFLLLLSNALGFAHAQSAKPQQVGVIQYNVKNSQGGWISNALPATLDMQVDLIATRIAAGATTPPPKSVDEHTAPVDFISLVQSDLSGKDADRNHKDAIISDLLAQRKIGNWKTISSFCRYDGTELAYDSGKWDLVAGPGVVNPLVDAKSRGDRQHGWTWRQDAKQAWDCDGRPYNIAYFQNKNTGFKLLFIIAHMPHCGDYNFTGCIANLHGPGANIDFHNMFDGDIASVVGTTDFSGINLLMAGDLNEFGESNDGATFGPIFPQFGKLQISTALKTCCADSSYGRLFDRLLVNGGAAPKAYILDTTSTGTITYPLDPGFDKRNEGQKCGGKACVNEEHKAIFGLAEFP